MELGKNTIPLEGRPALMEVALLLVKQMRPRQWSKNLLVFGAFLFSADSMNMEGLMASFVAFLLFCFVSGCVYILNDYVDREADRQHPEKAKRPMASGRLNPMTALLFGAVLLTLSLTAAFLQHVPFGFLLAAYFIMNVSYSLKLKHIVILDIMMIASGFGLRALGGALVIDAGFTSWFLMCVFCISLFLAIGKRRHELLLLEHNKASHRKVLVSYSETLLNQLSGIVTAMTIMSYSLYTFISEHSIYLMWTIPCVIYGMFRYLYLIHVLGKGGKPEELLYEDKGILASTLVFGIAVILILKV
ncbi:decaprenyl-phosphate phosphoribosyltransferase [Paenibacillus montaniterrae]|uniref:Decaprenyl-phosphate phosphoribosyltransferase n=1 Tax=Paenibacillus montaniterrae TaxID=429341 RepID=A0A920CVG4_9BACL|nr:decaprenyl-phosphate phosphoribosyltransferase [Paenibacillus montaniterrae]GIP14961.1 decaprenyl-phosphate phosphoribosyltransferase [Paenibacillus montaniterrae]